MTDSQIVSPQAVDDIVERAHQMRAEAIRTSFGQFVGAIKSLFGKVGHAVSIPKTEQL